MFLWGCQNKRGMLCKWSREDWIWKNTKYIYNMTVTKLLSYTACNYLRVDAWLVILLHIGWGWLLGVRGGRGRHLGGRGGGRRRGLLLWRVMWRGGGWRRLLARTGCRGGLLLWRWRVLLLKGLGGWWLVEPHRGCAPAWTCGAAVTRLTKLTTHLWKSQPMSISTERADRVLCAI